MGRSDVCRALWASLAAAALVTGCGHFGSSKSPAPEPMRAYVDARTSLLQAADDDDPEVRVHAIEAIVAVEPEAAGGIIKQSLRSNNPLPVVAAAVVAAGATRYLPAKETLKDLAADPKVHPKLLAVVVYALHRMGDTSHTTALGGLLHHKDPFVRAEAARMMGKLGEQSAIGPLKSRQSDERNIAVRLNIAEALARLGDDRALGLLEAYTKDQYMESPLIAVEGLGLLQHQRALYVLRKTVRNKSLDPIVCVAAAKNLAALGDDRGYGRAIKALTDPEGVLRKARGKRAEIRPMEVTALQVYAAKALGYMKREAAVDELHPLLLSRRGSVRVAAAEAILRLLRAYRRSVLPPPPKEPPAATGGAAAEPPPRVIRPPKLHRSGGKD